MSVYTSSISRVIFGVIGSDDVKKESVVPITTHDSFRNNAPYPGGVYTAELGTIDHSYKCLTCGNGKRLCMGHDGHVMLNYPVWNPFYVVDGRKWLKLICQSCGNPVIDSSKFITKPAKTRLDLAAKMARAATNRKCVHCNAYHPIIKKDKVEPLIAIAEYADRKERMFPHSIINIFNSITDETVVKLGRKIACHPRKYILSAIKVPSVIIRPDTKKVGGKRSKNDDITVLLQVLIKKNTAMSAVIPQIIDQKAEKQIMELNNTYYDIVRASGEATAISLAKRWKGKAGRFRQTQLGKRIRIVARSTIIGDAKVKINEVIIPYVFARTVYIEEIVQNYNKERLAIYVQNGKDKYPGILNITTRNGVVYSPETYTQMTCELEIGDIVSRNVIDGDVVDLNRQPSLSICSIGTHFVKVHMDPAIKTIAMNVISTPLYNADFDGDQMNLLFGSRLADRNEIRELTLIDNWMISHTNSAPIIGQKDDSIIGLAELTRSKVLIDKYHGMLLFQTTTILPDLSDIGPGDTKTGREYISMALPNINLTRMTEYYNPGIAHFIKYDPDEIKVVIKNGKLLTGVLDKKTIGTGAAGGVYHIIANDYSNSKAIDVMFNMQQMSIAYILQAGYTVGIKDILISQESKHEIEGISADILNKSRIIVERLYNGEIIPPIGKTVEQFFEELQINTLRITDDFTGAVLNAIDHRTNGLYKLIAFGSKGKFNNLLNMISSIGQKLINGERMRQRFGYKRTLPYFRRFDVSPESRGYTANSVFTGMTTPEYMFNAMSARFEFISKALSTSITGEQNRRSIKNTESAIVDNQRMVVKHTSIVQFAYGEDFLDPRKLERVRFPTVMINDKAFEAYSHPDFPAFFEKMAQDRARYREIFLQIEATTTKEPMTDERLLPVNVERVVRSYSSDLSDESNASSPTHMDLAAKVARVEELILSVPYVLMNAAMERAKKPVPEICMHTTWLICMQIRIHLHPHALAQISGPSLNIICDRVRFIYSQALIDPGTAAGLIAAQCFSEPLVQYMLDATHHAASGGSSTSGMTNANELLKAKDVDMISWPSMLVPVLPEYASDRSKVQEIANNIEVMKFSQFIKLWQVYSEKYGEPLHSTTKHEAEMITSFAKNNPLIRPPSDLTRWCIRVVLDKTAMILKNMPIELIVKKLRESYPDIYLVYSAENVHVVIMRIYMRNVMFRSAATVNNIITLGNKISDTVIRGVDGVTATTVVKMLRNKVDDTGAVVRNDNILGVKCTGTNLARILEMPMVDKYKVFGTAVQEVCRTFGIEAARRTIIWELHNVVDVCEFRHLTLYADEMTRIGRVTAIDASGIKARENPNILLRMGASAPLAAVEEGAIHGANVPITGITGPLLVGQVPKYGTAYNTFHMDAEFIKKHVKSATDILQDLLD
jgi:DNA-directed RNA polymerase II subunit RPB1